MARPRSNLLIALLASTLALAACGEKEEPDAASVPTAETPDSSVSSGPLPPPDGAVSDPGKPGGRLGAEIKLIGGNTRAGGTYELTYSIRNTGKVAIGFGVCGVLERRTGTDWIAVNTEQICPELLAVLGPGEVNRDLIVALPSMPKTDAEFRIVHEVFAQDQTARRLRLVYDEVFFGERVG
jgi:hypothetical protein